jgi:hypothetical protein
MPAEPESDATREIFPPETTIAIAALFVAVSGLAHSIGGIAAAVTAAAVGVAIACLLVVPLISAARTAVPETGRRRVSWLALTLTAALVITALAVAGLFVYDAVRIQDEKDTRSAIRTAILRSYDAELAWYKDPAADKRADLEQWFVAPSAGGERMTIIVAAIDRLRRCHRKIGPEAATTTFVNAVDVSGSEAEAHMVQSLYQPVLDLRNGKWVERQLRPQDISFSVPDQIYLLKREQGRWKVQSAPQPQNLQGC